MIDTEESDSALGGIDPSAIARTGRGIYPGAKSTGVIAHRGKLEVRNNRVISPRRTARPRLRVASAIVGIGSIDDRPSRSESKRPDRPIGCAATEVVTKEQFTHLARNR